MERVGRWVVSSFGRRFIPAATACGTATSATPALAPWATMPSIPLHLAAPHTRILVLVIVRLFRAQNEADLKNCPSVARAEKATILFILDAWLMVIAW